MADTFNNWDEIAAAMDKATGQVVRKTALDGEANIKAEITSQDLVDTGFMRNSTYARTHNESTYGQGGSPPKGATLLPEIKAPKDDKTAYVASGADYTFWLNYGAHGRPGHGFFEKGMERTRAGFDAAMAAISAAMKRAGR